MSRGIDDRDERSQLGRWAVGATAVAAALVFALVAGVLTGSGSPGELVVRSPAPSTSGTTSQAPPLSLDQPPPARTGSPSGQETEVASKPPLAPVGGASPGRAVVTTLQVVPALRDVIVVVGGARYSTDALGRVELAAEHHGQVAEVIGLTAQPSLARAEFTGWADGVTDPVRPLASVDGPVATLGFEVRHRVLVDVSEELARDVGRSATVRLDTGRGEIELRVGTATWVLAMVAERTEQGLVARPVSYTATSLESGGVDVVLAPTTFIASPEATWTVDAAT